ncbi:type IV secretion system protein VirB10 [Pusillimonas sp. T7-7]|uniref:type IV secretion system protein VirB10 n=1 Tax=Pusillimonas sp. (strain T7-7) TaxID=1007105 RepID=UPI0002084C3D|nr:type IV secretion system protein VirB10 [Pusillimonas sp. T7-7]AEC18846.1 type IV secretion system protein VirB10 [Pusillimonas sp. T7-7]
MKWFKKRSGEVDAVAQIEASQEQFEGKDGRPKFDDAAKPMAPGAKGFLMVLVLAGLVLLVLFVFRMSRSSDATSDRVSGLTPRIENVLPTLNLRPPRMEPAAQVESPPEPDPEPTPDPSRSLLSQLTLPGEKPLSSGDPIEQRRLKPGLRAEDSGQSSSGSITRSADSDAQADSGPMSDRLRPMRLSAAKAGFMGNRDLLLTQGAMIDCVQQTKFVTAQAGMITCYATREVRSASGRVVLIDAGTIFTGYQQSVLAHGQPRVGVVWSRLETPAGVIVNLDSPATGPLGEAGLDGQIDTHFAARFGAAIMISLISDAGNYLSNRGQGDSGQGFRFDDSQDAAKDAITSVLDHTMNIPPTLYRNQGGRIGIYVARDLDFSSVYELRTRNADTLPIQTFRIR